MNYLLDTQAFLWFEKGDPQLSEKAKAIIQSEDHIKFISVASFWEIVIKHSLGKLDLHIAFEQLHQTKGYYHLEIDLLHLLQLQKLPHHHRDPFDRLIVSQALAEEMILISSDEMFDAYGVNRIWQ